MKWGHYVKLLAVDMQRNIICNVQTVTDFWQDNCDGHAIRLSVFRLLDRIDF